MFNNRSAVPYMCNGDVISQSDKTVSIVEDMNKGLDSREMVLTYNMHELIRAALAMEAGNGRLNNIINELSTSAKKAVDDAGKNIEVVLKSNNMLTNTTKTTGIWIGPMYLVSQYFNNQNEKVRAHLKETELKVSEWLAARSLDAVREGLEIDLEKQKLVHETLHQMIVSYEKIKRGEHDICIKEIELRMAEVENRRQEINGKYPLAALISAVFSQNPTFVALAFILLWIVKSVAAEPTNDFNPMNQMRPF